MATAHKKAAPRRLIAQNGRWFEVVSAAGRPEGHPAAVALPLLLGRIAAGNRAFQGSRAVLVAFTAVLASIAVAFFDRRDISV
jgi:hypothetical protein